MRYVVLGAGAVGGTVGGRLHLSGHDVVLVARGEHLARLQRDGLRLVTPDVDERLAVPAVGGPEELELTGDDVLVLATKSQHTAAAMTRWSAADVRTTSGRRPAGEALPVLCAQNGIANEPAALRWFASVVGVCVWLPCGVPEPGTVVAPSAPLTGMLHLGSYPVDRQHPVVQQAAADLEASHFAAPCPDDVMAWKRAKLLSNLGNVFDALFAPDADWQPLLARAVEEARAVFAAAGLPVTSPEEERAARGRSMVPQEIAGQDRPGGSTYQSMARGADSVETDYLNGEVAALGRLNSVPTPVNVALQILAARSLRDGVGARAVPVDDLRKLLD